MHFFNFFINYLKFSIGIADKISKIICEPEKSHLLFWLEFCLFVTEEILCNIPCEHTVGKLSADGGSLCSEV